MSNTQSPPLSFAVPDVSALAKSLRASIESASGAPTQVQMLNWLAKCAGHRNYQSFRAHAMSAPVPKDTIVASTVLGARKTVTSTENIVLSAHAAKALTQFDTDGKLARWPHKFAVQRIALWALWMRFDAKRRYTEKEVNSVINAWHLYGDHATLRRELVNMKLLARESDCSVYWKLAQQPADDVKAFLRALRASRE
jgi:hypothetical protein